jgi:transketolase
MTIGDIVPVKVDGDNKTAVLACGNILDAARTQIENEDLPYNLYSVPFVKPINIEHLIEIVKLHSEGIITIEEHQKSCGMSSALVEILNDLYSEGKIATYPKLRRIAIPDEFVEVVGNQTYLRKVEQLNL